MIISEFLQILRTISPNGLVYIWVRSEFLQILRKLGPKSPVYGSKVNFANFTEIRSEQSSMWVKSEFSQNLQELGLKGVV